MASVLISKKRTAKAATATAKASKKKNRKYGHYESYQDYSENILVKPMRQLLGLLKDKNSKG